MIHTDILSFQKARYLWWSLALMLIAVVIYATQSSVTQPPNGGTWQGYTLGTIGALLIVWLALLGWRKRAYRSTAGTLAGWTSAHVYLGTSVLVIGTLHSAGQLGWNIHSLAYVLMVIVVLSGFFGIALYTIMPSKSAMMRGGRTREQLFLELQGLSNEAIEVSQSCGADIERAVGSAIQGTRIGGGLRAQLSRADRSQVELEVDGKVKRFSNRDQSMILSYLSDRLPSPQKQVEIPFLRELLAVMSRRQVIIRQIEGDVRMLGLMRLWLYLHVPVTVALLVSLVIHILSTFFYW